MILNHVYDTMSDSDSHGEMEVEELSEHSDDENRLHNTDWCVVLTTSCFFNQYDILIIIF